MQNKKIIILFAVALTGLSGCSVEIGSDVPDEWYDIRESLVDKRWEYSYHNEADYENEENDVLETWIFEDDGNGSMERIATYQNGATENYTYNFLWALTIDLVINIDDFQYWTIEEITDTRLYVYLTPWDPIQNPGQTKTYYEFYRATDSYSRQ